MKLFGVFSGEGKLGAFLVAAGAMTFFAIIFKRATRRTAG